MITKPVQRGAVGRVSCRTQIRKFGLTAQVMLAIAIVCAVFLVPAEARAHKNGTAYLEVHELGPGQAVASLMSPRGGAEIRIDWGRGCKGTPVRAPNTIQPSTYQTFEVRCRDALSTKTITVEGLGLAVSVMVVSVTFSDQRTLSGNLSAEHNRLVLAFPPNNSRLKWYGFIEAGLWHILSGADHILLLIGLIASTRQIRKLLAVVTAFTLGHALSYFSFAAGIVAIPASVAELCIAISLVLLALDIEKKPPSPGLCVVFGIVHGLGFASGLNELGVGHDDVISAVVGFNSGVELGQLAIIVASLTFVRVVAKLGVQRVTQMPSKTALGLAALTVGGAGAYWTIDRCYILMNTAL